eukprot:365305-Chlamydomonas_euryale.AAC.5
MAPVHAGSWFRGLKRQNFGKVAGRVGPWAWWPPEKSVLGCNIAVALRAMTRWAQHHGAHTLRGRSTRASAALPAASRPQSERLAAGRSTPGAPRHLAGASAPRC